jgi:hypothetical protein
MSTCIEHITIAKMLSAMLDGPQTVYDIQDLTGWHKNTVGHYVRALRKEGAIYVATWEQDRRKSWSLRGYMIGRKKDAPKPKKQTSSMRCKRYRARVKHISLIQMTAGALA